MFNFLTDLVYRITGVLGLSRDIGRSDGADDEFGQAAAGAGGGQDPNGGSGGSHNKGHYQEDISEEYEESDPDNDSGGYEDSDSDIYNRI